MRSRDCLNKLVVLGNHHWPCGLERATLSVSKAFSRSLLTEGGGAGNYSYGFPGWYCHCSKGGPQVCLFSTLILQNLPLSSLMTSGLHSHFLRPVCQRCLRCCPQYFCSIIMRQDDSLRITWCVLFPSPKILLVQDHHPSIFFFHPPPPSAPPLLKFHLRTPKKKKESITYWLLVISG